jgi:hypothetical protein
MAYVDKAYLCELVEDLGEVDPQLLIRMFKQFIYHIPYGFDQFEEFAENANSDESYKDCGYNFKQRLSGEEFSERAYNLPRE